jgi:leucyl aminopeptidase
MTVNIEYTKKLKKIKNFTLFCNEKLYLTKIEKKLLGLSEKEYQFFINENKKIKKNFIKLNINIYESVNLIKINKNNSNSEIEKIGAKFFKYIESNHIFETSFFEENIRENFRDPLLKMDSFLLGLKLKSYHFTKYKTNTKSDKFKITIFHKTIEKNINQTKLSSIIDGVNLTKDLVSEPGNILHPDEYVNRINKLKSFGLKISIIDKIKLKKLGMNALLGVGQGSIRGSYLAIIEWHGSSNKKKQPLAFVGKGVCFDTGGISLKPAKFMEDMTYDMAGSAVVVGLMKTLALRKAKINAVGVVGLVENMPDGNAQRPGDIVKSYSGKTIEILNTDAEGRLVLADALTYTEKKYKPKFIVDLATLTGAIIVSLGSEYAGLFSNDDKISDQLSKAGEKVGEKVWRMPLNENYDKLINSKKADMQNINYVGGAGSTTAAQFLQRFILNKTPWAHLDIAGMAFSKYGGALNSGGATGYGVRLLNQLIEDNYE